MIFITDKCKCITDDMQWVPIELQNKLLMQQQQKYNNKLHNCIIKCWKIKQFWFQNTV